MFSRRSAPSLPFISPATAIAPEFTIGLNGRFFTLSSTMELKASPVGSTPTRVEHEGLPVLPQRVAVEKGLRYRLDRERLRGVARLVDPAVHGRDGDAEPLRPRARQLGNIGRDLPLAHRPRWRSAPRRGSRRWPSHASVRHRKAFPARLLPRPSLSPAAVPCRETPARTTAPPRARTARAAPCRRPARQTGRLREAWAARDLPIAPA